MNMDAQSEQHALQTIERTVVQSKAVELSEVTKYDGQGALCPVQDTGQIVPVRPATLVEEQETAIQTQAQELVEMIRSDPNNWRIQGLIFNLG